MKFDFEIWFQKMFEIVDDDNRIKPMPPEHRYTITSPCEPDCSGELKISHARLTTCNHAVPKTKPATIGCASRMGRWV